MFKDLGHEEEEEEESELVKIWLSLLHSK